MHFLNRLSHALGIYSVGDPIHATGETGDERTCESSIPEECGVVLPGTAAEEERPHQESGQREGQHPEEVSCRWVQKDPVSARRHYDRSVCLTFTPSLSFSLVSTPALCFSLSLSGPSFLSTALGPVSIWLLCLS